MKVAHISTLGAKSGAARGAYRIHQGILRLGHESIMLVKQAPGDDPSVQVFRPHRDFLSRLRRRLRRTQIQRSFVKYRKTRPDWCRSFSDDRSQYGASLPNQIPRCDIINLHWIAGFVDYPSFFTSVSESVPIVWRLSDMNPFTGGCHYDAGCGKYNTGCGACPQLGSDDEKDLSREIWERKRSVFKRVDPDSIHFIAQSQWMKDEIQNSVLLQRFPVAVIPNGLDIDVFAPRDQEVARDVLGIPQQAKVVLFVAGSVINRRKGFPLFVNALESLHNLPGLFLLSVGHGKPAIDRSISHLHVGHLSNNRLLSLIYSAADLFVIPSLQDNLPNTVLEAMACGAPVVGFDVGGIPDMVRPGVTGQLAPVGDVEALREAIVDVLRDPAKRAEMSANCRRIAIEEYALEVQARQYIKLYQSMLG